MASRCLGICCPLARPIQRATIPPPYSAALSWVEGPWDAGKVLRQRGNVVCSAAQGPSTATGTVSAEPAKKEADEKPKRVSPAKAPAKSLPEMMEEDVIPALRSILEAEEDISQIELSFNDNRLEGSFTKKEIPYYFWAFFPDGVLNGPRGFSLSSYGSEVSTVEPFLIDEKKITPRHVVFWVEKRLAAQGIIPVWKE
ncbi:unnamed protein product [Spirodela intermedia]|uniref:Uncharacterized protein n=2 Tax=Spirodela intermedia TaxID=51605 RepID=A0A7I8JKW6_SPIIN|nr:unnamed protein product [Spirodela intermedia]CAA6670122.1 unnamed protein product [Spirodela intermedia]CAA7407170.1 unnamed protein product [Spirodela intermedia]